MERRHPCLRDRGILPGNQTNGASKDAREPPTGCRRSISALLSRQPPVNSRQPLRQTQHIINNRVADFAVEVS
jgi:hypothetical protein